MFNRPHQSRRKMDDRNNQCSHSVYIKGLCGECGARVDPPQSTSVSMIHSVPELKVSEEYAKQIGKSDQQRLIQDRKLVLLVDLDQTILHTTHEKVENDPNVHSFRLWPGHPIYYTKLRPYLQEFLDEMSEIYELHIFTFGCRQYAHKIASLIDPEQKYFGNRILSRDESVDQYSKKGNLNNLFPCGDAMVCIIDDRSDVWREAGNLIQVKAYSYFKTSISDGALRAGNSAAASAEEEESLDKDVDALEALLGLEEDSEEEVGSSKKKFKCDPGTETGEMPADTTTYATKEDSESEATPDGSESSDQPENLMKASEKTSDANEATVSEPTTPTSSESSDDKEDEREIEEPETNNQDDDSTQSSAKVQEDPDDHLLHLQKILSRIHEKWYMELDEQRQFLVEGESYKLPDIKDIIKRYLRVRYDRRD